MVVLPPPLFPTRATMLPLGMVKLTSLRAQSHSGEYLNQTPENRISRQSSGKSSSPRCPSGVSVSVVSISKSLSADAMDYAKFAQMLVNGGELNGVRILGRKTVELMRTNNLPPEVGTIGGSPSAGGTGFGLGVSVLVDEAAAGNIGSVGQFGWAGAASTWVIMDPKEDMVAIVLTQYMPSDFEFAGKWQTLVYQALVD